MSKTDKALLRKMSLSDLRSLAQQQLDSPHPYLAVPTQAEIARREAIASKSA